MIEKFKQRFMNWLIDLLVNFFDGVAQIFIDMADLIRKIRTTKLAGWNPFYSPGHVLEEGWRGFASELREELGISSPSKIFDKPKQGDRCE